jgi:hypothetical protein
MKHGQDPTVPAALDPVCMHERMLDYGIHTRLLDLRRSELIKRYV